MTHAIREVALNPIHIDTSAAARFSADGLVVADPLGLLHALGYIDLGAIRTRLPAIEQGGVQTAAMGVIQDPAGSAIGSGSRPAGGGAAGAIYARFPDLQPIDAIAPRSAIFNRSTGPGRRVLHTHAPMLPADPRDPAARNTALADLANAYCNALVAVNERGAALGADGQRLNLVPISASIYAGGFLHHRYQPAHLDPSYTLTAILIAIGELLRRGEPVMELALYYFTPQTCHAAVELVEGILGRTN